jgi:hypothetical protein
MAICLLAIFTVGSFIGLFVAWHGIRVWGEAGFTWAKFAVDTHVALARYFTFVGGGVFGLCALCVVRLLRYDLRSALRKKRNV